MGLSSLPVTTLVDSFFRAFLKYSTNEIVIHGEYADLRAFLIGLGIIFKGTVEEKIKCKLRCVLLLTLESCV
jgi:hypothetical protein